MLGRGVLELFEELLRAAHDTCTAAESASNLRYCKGTAPGVDHSHKATD